MGFWLEGREYPLGWMEEDTLLIGRRDTILIGGKRIRS